jgi:hypothetical protein
MIDPAVQLRLDMLDRVLVQLRDRVEQFDADLYAADSEAPSFSHDSVHRVAFEMLGAVKYITGDPLDRAVGNLRDALVAAFTSTDCDICGSAERTLHGGVCSSCADADGAHLRRLAGLPRG